MMSNTSSCVRPRGRATTAGRENAARVRDRRSGVVLRMPVSAKSATPGAPARPREAPGAQRRHRAGWSDDPHAPIWDSTNQLRTRSRRAGFSPTRADREGSRRAVGHEPRQRARRAGPPRKQEAFVIREPNPPALGCGSSPRAMAIDIVEARCALESVAARHAGAQRERADIARCAASYASCPAAARRHLLAYADKNPSSRRSSCACRDTAPRRLAAMLKSQERHPFSTGRFLQPGRADRSIMEHEELVRRDRRKGPAAAEAAMSSHLGAAAFARRCDRSGQRTPPRSCEHLPLGLEERHGADVQTTRERARALLDGSPLDAQLHC